MGLVARKTTVLLGGAALAIVGGVLQVSAQDGAGGDVVTNEAERQGRVTLLQRLVVGAGTEKVAIDTPQSVSVVEQEDIDVMQATNVGEILRNIPGVNTAGSDRTLGQGFNIRGIGAPESAGEEGRIIVNVDGATKFYEQYRMGGFFNDPELFKRVEVLRGPASSTLYGSGALGGVINFTTKDASDFIADGETGALRLKGGYNSNRDGWLGSFVLAQRFAEDFDFLLAGNYRTSDSYKTGNGTIINSSDFSAWSGLGKMTARVGDEGTLRLSYQQWDSDAADQDYAQIGGALSDGTVSGFGTVDRHVIDRTGVLSYENPFSDNDMLDLKLSASVSDTSVAQTNASGIPGQNFVCGANATANMFCDTDYGYRTLQLKAENTSTWAGANWENYLSYGLQLSHQTRTSESFLPNGDPYYFAHHPEGTDLKTGAFVQNEFILDERLTLIPGLRVDWRKLTPDESTGLGASTDDVAFSPKFAAHYKFNDTFAVFGSIAHTQRLPTLDEMFSTPFPSYGLGKEKSNNYELGFSVSAFDLVQPGDGLQFKATGFYNDISDLIYRQCSSITACNNGGYSAQYVNLNAATIYGAELELAYEADYVFASASYTHVVGKNDDTDAYLTSVAPHELALTLGGRLPEQGLSFGWRSRFVAAPADPALRSSEADWTGSSTRFAKSFDLHDVFVTWKPQDGQLRGWEVTGGIDNIFNSQYKEFLHNDAGKGRTFKVSLAKQFGW